MKLWDSLDMTEAKGLLSYVSRFGIDEDSRVAHELLPQMWPDRRETVLIVIGAGMDPQLHDREPATKLMERVNLRGLGKGLRWSAIVTDWAVLNNPKYLECPLISLGGPVANKLTDDLRRQLTTDPRGNDRLKVQHNIRAGERRITAWGPMSKDTADAVDLLMSSGILDDFLKLIWT
jgi:hypothetical protein